MPKHFETLWETCESFHKGSDTSIAISIDELMLKLNLYKAIDQKVEIPEKEREKIKSRTMGEILFTLTKLSLQDNINVFEAMKTALQYHS